MCKAYKQHLFGIVCLCVCVCDFVLFTAVGAKLIRLVHMRSACAVGCVKQAFHLPLASSRSSASLILGKN